MTQRKDWPLSLMPKDIEWLPPDSAGRDESAQELKNVKYIDPEFPPELEEHYWNFLLWCNNSITGNYVASDYAGYCGVSREDMRRVTRKLQQDGLVWLKYESSGGWSISAKGKQALQDRKRPKLTQPKVAQEVFVAPVSTTRWTSSHWFLLSVYLFAAVVVLELIRIWRVLR